MGKVKQHIAYKHTSIHTSHLICVVYFFFLFILLLVFFFFFHLFCFFTHRMSSNSIPHIRFVLWLNTPAQAKIKWKCVDEEILINCLYNFWRERVAVMCGNILIQFKRQICICMRKRRTANNSRKTIKAWMS